jgi:hypothetical protein
MNGTGRFVGIGLVLLAILLMAPGVSLSAGPKVAGPASLTTFIVTELELDCPDSCVLCAGEAHALHENAGLGGSEGDGHSCTDSHSCDKHDCNGDAGGTLAADDVSVTEEVEIVADLLVGAPPSEIATFLHNNPGTVTWNQERHALQFHGCGAEIVAHVPLRVSPLRLLNARPLEGGGQAPAT